MNVKERSKSNYYTNILSIITCVLSFLLPYFTFPFHPLPSGIVSNAFFVCLHSYFDLKVKITNNTWRFNSADGDHMEINMRVRFRFELI